MDNYEEEFEKFFKSDRKTMFVCGNNSEKIKKIIDYVLKNMSEKTFLIRSNRTGKTSRMGFPKEYEKSRTAGKKYKINNNWFYFDSMLTKNTWDKVIEYIDIVIVYPVDSLATEEQQECVDNLETNKYLKKIVYVSGVENKTLQPFFESDELVAID